MIGYFVSRYNRPQRGIKQHSGSDECKGRHQEAKAWLFEELFSISVGRGNYFGASSEGFLKASSSHKRQVMR
jgi:hypothetical protein